MPNPGGSGRAGGLRRRGGQERGRGAAAVLRPGGLLVVMDGKRPEGWQRLFLPAVWLIDLLAGADTGRRPWEWMAAHLEGVKMDDSFLFGLVYVAVGRRPAARIWRS